MGFIAPITTQNDANTASITTATTGISDVDLQQDTDLATLQTDYLAVLERNTVTFETGVTDKQKELNDAKNMLNDLPDFDALKASIEVLKATIDYQSTDLALLATKYSAANIAAAGLASTLVTFDTEINLGVGDTPMVNI